jgi:hypothetical protein
MCLGGTPASTGNPVLFLQTVSCVATLLSICRQLSAQARHALLKVEIIDLPQRVLQLF